MAKPLATEALVFEVAAALKTEGTAPTILNVQERIGGGSYTTIKRHLDTWAASQGSADGVEPPESVTAKADELGRVLWSTAVREADKSVQEAKGAAVKQVEAIGNELKFAQSQIEALELAESVQSDKARELSERLNQASIDLGKASLMAARVPDLEVRLQALQDELSSVRKDATTKAVEVGRLAGEADALRRQLTEVTAALVSLKGSPTAGI
jgi:hypothetical protein